MMRAARLHEYGKPLVIDEVPVPAVKGDEVLVRIAGSYVCSSDLDLISGKMPVAGLPLTLGHNNTGYIEKIGPAVAGFEAGEAVAVFGGWGCGRCRFCRQGEEQLCDMMRWVGFGTDGGYAEYLHVPAQRHLIKLGSLDPVESAPLLDAGLTPYRAVKKALPGLYPGSYAVVIGIGNLGYFAVQVMKVLSPGTRLIAVDLAEDRLQLASEFGADHAVAARGNVVSEIRRMTGGEGAAVVLDMVGSDRTLEMAAAVIGKKGVIMVEGVAGGSLLYSFLKFPFESSVTSTVWGSYAELEEVLALAAIGKLKTRIRRFLLEDINEVYRLMEAGKLKHQAVITP